MASQTKNSDNNVKGVNDSALNASFGRDCHEPKQVALGCYKTSACIHKEGKDRKRLKIATWNVRTPYQKRKIDTVVQEM